MLTAQRNPNTSSSANEPVMWGCQLVRATFHADKYDPFQGHLEDEITHYKDAFELHVSNLKTAQKKLKLGIGISFSKTGICFAAATGCIAFGFAGPVGWALGGACLLGAVVLIRNLRKEQKHVRVLQDINQQLSSLKITDDNKTGDLKFIADVRRFVNDLMIRSKDSSASRNCLIAINSLLRESKSIAAFKSALPGKVEEVMAREYNSRRNFLCLFKPRLDEKFLILADKFTGLFKLTRSEKVSFMSRLGR